MGHNSVLTLWAWQRRRTVVKAGGPIAALGVALALSAAHAITQSQPAAAQNAPKQSAPKAQNAAPAATGALPMPDAFRLNMRIRTTIVALNHANMTGNYTVFRDLAAPSFQQSHNAVQLGEIFADLRNRKIDLSPVFFVNPKLTQKPAIQPDGLLRLTGFFPTKPEQINFDMLFQFAGGRWLLYGVAVNTSPAKAEGATAGAPSNQGQGAGKTPPQPATGDSKPSPKPQAKTGNAPVLPAKKDEPKASSVAGWPPATTASTATAEGASPAGNAQDAEKKPEVKKAEEPDVFRPF